MLISCTVTTQLICVFVFANAKKEVFSLYNKAHLYEIQILFWADEDGAYYWHIKSGTIQREPPSPAPPDLRETLRSISINSDSVS